MRKGAVILLLAVIPLAGLSITGSRSANSNGMFRHIQMSEAKAAAVRAAEFKWHPNRPGITRAQIALGRAATLKFEFITTGLNVSVVKFGMPKHFADMGVIIDPKQVPVKGDKASSMAIFAIPPGTPLGKFDMTVVAVDAKTGKELGRGAIPFMLLPAGVGGC